MYVPPYIITKAKRMNPRDYDAYMSALSISPITAIYQNLH